MRSDMEIQGFDPCKGVLYKLFDGKTISGWGVDERTS
jgi:hypothetical protein